MSMLNKSNIQSWVNCSRTNVRVAIDFTINYSQAVLLCTTCATTSAALSPLALTVANFIKKYCKKGKSLVSESTKHYLISQLLEFLTVEGAVLRGEYIRVTAMLEGQPQQ